MKKFVSMLAVCVMLSFAVAQSFADEAKKEVTLKGTAVCAKCELHQTEKCQDAIKVSEDGKEVIYYIKKDAAAKGLHKEICKSPKENVTVTGVVSEKDGQKWITPSKID